MEVAVNDILQVLNKEAITEVKVILLLAKNTKRSIKVSMTKNLNKSRSRSTEKSKRRQNQSTHYK